MFTMFPAGSPGFGLAILRFSAAGAGIASVMSGGENCSNWICIAFLPFGLALLLGVLTPVSCIGSLALQGVIIYQLGPTGIAHCALSILLATAVLMLGPGAYSIDARLFGRRRVVVRKTIAEREPPK
jgi:uncharacterized membrane protein YphA (DoxX/SURF4 family)